MKDTAIKNQKIPSNPHHSDGVLQHKSTRQFQRDRLGDAAFSRAGSETIETDTVASQHMPQAVQRRIAEAFDAPDPIQLREASINRTGLPDQIKSGIENLSGMTMDDVKVHYNSSKPAQLQAHAYTQGTDIHVGPGQEKHLAHEAWHVVQQKQGRVKPTLQMAGQPVNDQTHLEREADVMGAKAVRASSPASSPSMGRGVSGVGIIQGNWRKRLLQAIHGKEAFNKYMKQKQTLPQSETNLFQKDFGLFNLNFGKSKIGGKEAKFESNLLTMDAGKNIDTQYLKTNFAKYGMEKLSPDMLELLLSTEFLGVEGSTHFLEEDSLQNTMNPKFYLMKLIAGAKSNRTVPSRIWEGLDENLESTRKFEWEPGLDFNTPFLLNLLPTLELNRNVTNDRLGSQYGMSMKTAGSLGEIVDKDFWMMNFLNFTKQPYDEAGKFELDQIPLVFQDLMDQGAPQRFDMAIENGITSSGETDLYETLQILEWIDSMHAMQSIPRVILDKRNDAFQDQQKDEPLPLSIVKNYQHGSQMSTKDLYKNLAFQGIPWGSLMALGMGTLLWKTMTGSGSDQTKIKEEEQ